MDSFLEGLAKDYNSTIIRDPTVDSWLFMSSPVPMLSIVAFYLYFVIALGPEIMKERRPYTIKGLVILYNAYQVCFNLWLLSQSSSTSDVLQLMFNSCKNNELRGKYTSMLAYYAWWYFFSKIIDLFDTVFFVLKKKQSHVTVLHVYHHSVMVIFTWVYLKFVPGEQGIFLAGLNTIVHAVMYFYYLIAALGPQYQKYLWWKKYLTKMQLLQFFLCFAYITIMIAMDCNVPKILSYAYFLLVGGFIYLFLDFYQKTYNVKDRASVAAGVCKID